MGISPNSTGQQNEYETYLANFEKWEAKYRPYAPTTKAQSSTTVAPVNQEQPATTPLATTPATPLVAVNPEQPLEVIGAQPPVPLGK